MAQDTDLRELLDRSSQYYARQNISTAIPAVIIEMPRFAEQQVITVRPLIERVFEDGTSLECADVYDVPVVFPTGGGGILTFPLIIGDTVLLVYSMRSLDEWLDGGGEKQTPKDNRHFNRTDAIAIPGIYTRSTTPKPSTTDVELRFKDGRLIMQPDNTVVLKNGATTITLSPDGTTNIDNTSASVLLATGGAVTISDGAASINMDAAGGVEITSTTLTHNGVNIGATHLHSGVTTGAGVTGVPQ